MPPQFSLSPRISPILSLRNVSSVPLTISSITPSANFVRGGDCGASLAPGGGCTLILQGAADKKTTGSVVITSNAYATPQKLIITKSPIGDSVGAVVQIMPDTLQFAPQFVGTSSPAQQLVVKNVGLQPSALGSIDLFGDFIQTNNCPAVLSPAAFCTIQVAYHPTATGNGFGQLGVTHDQLTDTLFLNGISSSSAIAASTTNVQFATQICWIDPFGANRKSHQHNALPGDGLRTRYFSCLRTEQHMHYSSATAWRLSCGCYLHTYWESKRNRNLDRFQFWPRWRSSRKSSCDWAHRGRCGCIAT